MIPLFTTGHSLSVIPAHQVSLSGPRRERGPAGVENLGWKLAAVIQGRAPAALLQTYDTERQHGARENILHSTRATDFMTPKNHITGCSATPCWICPGSSPLLAPWSTAAACPNPAPTRRRR